MNFANLRNYCRENSLFDYDGDKIYNPLLVMVSGGSDSVALLHILARGEIGSVANLRVLHVNHGLRDETALRDENFTRDLCTRLGVSCSVLRVDVAAFATRQGLNVEDAGRQLRYHEATALLSEFCRELGISSDSGCILSGHMADENVETFLMRMISGSGLRGLAGIPVRRGNIIRPLLDSSKAELQEYLISIGETWMEDETNLDTSHERAWVRHELLPQLISKNENFTVLLSRNMQVLREEEELITEITIREMEKVLVKAIPENLLVLSLEELRLAVPALQRRILRLAITDNFAAAERLEAEHIFAIISHFDDEKYQRDISGGLRVTVENGFVTVRSIVAADEAAMLEAETLAGADEILIDRSDFPYGIQLDTGVTVDFSVVDAADLELGSDVNVLHLPLNRIGQLKITNLREGDHFRPFGAVGGKKVTRFLRDLKVTAAERRNVRLLRNDADIVWVMGYRSSDDYRVEGDGPVLRVEVRHS